MKLMTKEQAVVKNCRARTIYGFIENGGIFQSESLFMGVAKFDKSKGDMIPHVHAEEGMYVLDCARAYARCGPSKDELGERQLIQPGMIMWFPDGEWHVFEFEDGGFLDIVFCLPIGKMDRPE